MSSIAILGGGIAGLTAAHRLQAAGLDVTVFEAEAEPGGVIRSERTDGFLVEYGPNTLRARSPLLNTLIDDLDLESAVLEAAPEVKNRYIVRGGQLVALPTSPPGLLRSKAFSGRGKLRLLGEPFIRPAPPGTEESVAAFVQRRLGREALAYGADPFIAGIFAGDPEQLSLRHAFPRLFELEQQHGSLLKGMLRSDRSGERLPERPFSFRDGLHQFPRALADPLGERLRTNTPVAGLHREAAGWRVALQDGSEAAPPFDAVISTLPLYVLPKLNANQLDLAPFKDVRYAPVSIIHLGFRRADVGHPLDGFGVLIPAAEAEFNSLGAIFSSTLFPDRAPKDHVLLTMLIGGARRSELTRLSAEALRKLVLHDLRELLDVQGAPVFTNYWTWSRAIPQYHVGYGAIKDHLADLEATHPGLFFAGNYRRGIAVPDAMTSGDEAARRIIEQDA